MLREGDDENRAGVGDGLTSIFVVVEDADADVVVVANGLVSL